MKTALITGVCGQDGAYLSQFLLSKGYKVIGAYRRVTTPNFYRLDALGIKDDIHLTPFEILDAGSIMDTIANFEPDEIYNLAAQSFVPVSFKQAAHVGDVNGIGVTGKYGTKLHKAQKFIYEEQVDFQVNRILCNIGIAGIEFEEKVFGLPNQNLCLRCERLDY